MSRNHKISTLGRKGSDYSGISQLTNGRTKRKKKNSGSDQAAFQMGKDAGTRGRFHTTMLNLSNETFS